MGQRGKDKLVRDAPPPANVHDSRVFDDLINPDTIDPGVWAGRQGMERVQQDAGCEIYICDIGN